jgi:hypothetical protein
MVIGLPARACLRRNLWWAREDSNLQPSGYERATLPEKVSAYWHFRARSVTSVRVWLRRFIGHLLVERDREFRVTHGRQPRQLSGVKRSRPP